MHKPIKPKTKTKMLKDAKRDLNKAMQNSAKDYNNSTNKVNSNVGLGASTQH